MFTSFLYRLTRVSFTLTLSMVALVTMGLGTCAHAFSFFDVVKQARHLAARGYQAPEPNLPESLRALKFTDYQQIQFKPERLLWRNAGTKFTLDFYHEGMHFNTPIKVNEIDATGVHEIKFDPKYFDYGALKLSPSSLKHLGFAGFRIRYPINHHDKKDDEIASFLGASYFRIVGKNQSYGLSARGLAIDTALPSGEEFPYFREFWIARPAPEDNTLTLYALLDSPHATGAYRFMLRPAGGQFQVDVRTRIFLRDPVGRLGIAPLTSMFLYGSNQPSPVVNYRPEIHDSDGLSLHAANGEWVWRPLVNPRRLTVSAFSLENPRGFGLLQRGRAFSRYEDLDDHYEKRPSLWIVPQGNWGKGSVQLVAIPTKDETNDNIVAFWVPDKLPAKGDVLSLHYRMIWTINEASLHNPALAWVAQTRRSREEVKGPDLIRRADGSITYVIDFVGPSLRPGMAITANTWIDRNGQIVENTVRPNTVTGGYRLTLRLNIKDTTKPVEIRTGLTDGKAPLSETWSYLIPSEPEPK